MHFGNLRTALFNYLYARHHQGVFLLRVEDTDAARSEIHFKDGILTDLKWFGLEWQEGPYFQSERQAIYDEYYDKLIQIGRVYPCFCTEQQLAITRKVQMAAHQPPRYAGTCRNLSTEEIAKRKAEGMPYTLRFKIDDDKTVEFEDLVKGKQRFLTNHIGDFIICRQDGSASFMFCNAVDDALMGINHALRGDDHLTNTPRQILILEALGLPVPKYGHLPTILGPDHAPLSKRNGSRSTDELRKEGYLPLAILNYLFRLGHYDSDLSFLDLGTLAAHFDLAHVGSAPAHYDAAQLNHWQKEAMHRSDWQDCWWQILKATPAIEDLVSSDQVELFVKTIQPNLVMPSEALRYAETLFSESLILNAESETILKEAGISFFEVALNCVESLDFEPTILLKTIQEKTGCKGKAFFAPIRIALTGETHGPELAKILELMGKERVRQRLMNLMGSWVKNASNL